MKISKPQKNSNSKNNTNTPTGTANEINIWYFFCCLLQKLINIYKIIIFLAINMPSLSTIKNPTEQIIQEIILENPIPLDPVSYDVYITVTDCKN